MEIGVTMSRMKLRMLKLQISMDSLFGFPFVWIFLYLECIIFPFRESLSRARIERRVNRLALHKNEHD